ncbi:MAG: uracil-DNA glycosylase family protein [Betaproteobacteria bacterium]
MELDRIVCEARACRVCEAHLPAEPRPVLRVAASARLLIIGQAPGRLVHESGIPWNDPSGQRLREWLGLSPQVFYDTARVAILPIGMCYRGTVNGADLPPRRECAPLWHPKIVPQLPRLQLTLLVGGYAQAFHLEARRKQSVTETVRAFREYLPGQLPLPHPSWRNSGWLKRNPWFDLDLVPELRRQVQAALR